MTKKHFVKFAEEIKHSDRSDECKMFAAMVVIRVAEYHNAQFDRDRFLVACGLRQST